MRPSDRYPDAVLLPALRAGDEAAYRFLVRRDHARLVSVARALTRSVDLAEEVVQDAWLTLTQSLDAFEGRSSLRSWLTGIVIHKARRAAAKGRRTRSFADMAQDSDGDAFEPDEFLADGHWSVPPWHWTEIDLERACAGRQVWAVVQAAIDALPAAQRAVLVLRDVEGLSAFEAARALGLTEAQQRPLLHKARVRLQAAFAAITRDARVGSPRPLPHPAQACQPERHNGSEGRHELP